MCAALMAGTAGSAGGKQTTLSPRGLLAHRYLGPRLTYRVVPTAHRLALTSRQCRLSSPVVLVPIPPFPSHRVVLWRRLVSSSLVSARLSLPKVQANNAVPLLQRWGCSWEQLLHWALLVGSNWGS